MLTSSIKSFMAHFVFGIHGGYHQVLTHERHLLSTESVQRIDPIKKLGSLKIEIQAKTANKLTNMINAKKVYHKFINILAFLARELP